MSSIPLPALDIRTPQQPQQNLLGDYGQFLALQNQQRNAPLQTQALQQQVQGQGLQVQQQQQDLKDQQGISKWFMSIDPKDPNAFDPGQVGKTLANMGVSGKGIMAAQQQLMLHQQQVQTLTKDQLANQQEQANNLYSAINGVIGVTDPQQRAQAISALIPQAVQAKAIQPQQAQQLMQNPAAITDDVLKSMQHGLGVSSAFLASVARMQTAQTGAQAQAIKAPGEQAASDAEVLKTTAQQLANVPDQATYEAQLGELPYKVAKSFPQQFDKNAVLQVGMAPNEQMGTAQRQQEMDQQQRLAQYHESNENYRAALGRQSTQQNQIMTHGLNQIDQYSADPQHGYAQYVSQANAVKNDIASAKNGNQVAASMEPLMLALGVSSFAGVHRINTTEINRAGPQVGSVFRRVNNLVDQLGSGKPTDAQLNEAQGLVDDLTSARHQAYLNSVNVIAANTGIDPGKVMVFDKTGNMAPLASLAKKQPQANPNGPLTITTHSGRQITIQ